MTFQLIRQTVRNGIVACGGRELLQKQELLSLGTIKDMLLKQIYFSQPLNSFQSSVTSIYLEQSETYVLRLDFFQSKYLYKSLPARNLT